MLDNKLQEMNQKTMEERIYEEDEYCFKSGVKYRGSDRWWERRWWLWWGNMRRMGWTRRRVNRKKLTEWRWELIPQVRWCISEKRLVICNETGTDGRARVTGDEELVLHVDW